MKQLFSLLFLSIILVACQENNIFQQDRQLTYYRGCLNFPLEEPLSNFNHPVTLEFEKNKLIKKTGYKTLGGVYLTEIYDELEYSENTIHIRRKDDVEDLDIAPYYRTIILDEKGRMIRKDYMEDLSEPLKVTQSISFTYNSEDQITSSITDSKGGTDFKADYYYNQTGNLDSVVSQSTHDGVNWNPSSTYKFYDYSTKPNPLKGIVYFDDIFYQTLSENNFRSYEKIKDWEDSEEPNVNITECGDI